MVLIGILSFGCSAPKKFQVVSKKFLKQEIETTKAPPNLGCSWYYGNNQSFHFFSYTCSPTEEPRGSVLTIIKKYKIQRTSLLVWYKPDFKESLEKIDTLNSNSGLAVDSIKIKW